MSTKNSTNPRAVVARHAKRVTETVQWARSRTTRKQTDEHARSVAKKCLSSNRSKAIEYVVTLVVDAAQRGSLEDSEAIGLHLVAIARAEHAAANPETLTAQLSVKEAQMLEEAAEGDVEQAEMAMAQNEDSLSHQLRYLAAAAAHTRTRRQLDAAVRRAAASAE